MKNFKKLFTGFIIAVFMMTYTAPVGMCAASVNLPPLPQASKTSKPVKSNLVLNGDLNFSKKNPLITLSLRNADVKQVLRMFADKAGMNIIFHYSVEKRSSEDTKAALNDQIANMQNAQNNPNDNNANNNNNLATIQPTAGKAGNTSTVTMDLVKVPLNDAFKMVIQVTDLSYFIEGNTIVVLTTEAASKSGIGRQNMSIIPVQYIDASKVAKFLNTNIFGSGYPGLSNTNIAVTNTEKNEIILFGNQNDYQIAKKIIEKFDVKPLEETFVVNHTTPKEMSSMICKVLFKDLAKTGDDDSVVVEGKGDSEEEDDDDDDEDEDEDSVSTVKLGKGKIACQFRAPVDEEQGSGKTENKANEASKLISLDSGGLTIVYFTERGIIYARGGTEAQMKQIKNFIAENDKEQLQAYLEMSIIELNESGSKEFSNTWNVYSSFFTGSFTGAGGLATAAPTYVIGDAIPAMFQPTGGQILPKYTGAPVVTYAINYLISNGKGRVLSDPKILISNGKKSKIELTSSYVKKVTSQYQDTNSSAIPTVQKTYDIAEDLGIEIEIQPFISPDGYVTLNIKPTYSTIKEQITEPRTLTTSLGTSTIVNDLVATLIDKRELNLQNVRIKDGETMVIAGMLKETETKDIDKMPFLGDLPLIGMFFRSTSSKKEKSELVIMLTPKIIKDTVNNEMKSKVAL